MQRDGPVDIVAVFCLRGSWFKPRLTTTRNVLEQDALRVLPNGFLVPDFKLWTTD